MSRYDGQKSRKEVLSRRWHFSHKLRLSHSVTCFLQHYYNTDQSPKSSPFLIPALLALDLDAFP